MPVNVTSACWAQLQLAGSRLDAGERVAHPQSDVFLPLLWRQGLTQIFLRDEACRRPVYGGTQQFQTDPHWKVYLLFSEYFHGDNGAGLGASHQTGWTVSSLD